MATGDPFKHVIPGQPAAFQAAWVNAVSDHLRHGGGPSTPVGAPRLSPGIVWVQNSTGAALGRFAAVGLAGTIFAPGDPGSAEENGFASRIGFVGDSLANADYSCKYAVLVEPCADGAIAPAVAWGLAIAYVAITDAGHNFAEADQASGLLLSGAKGSSEILMRATDTGSSVLCVIRIGGPAASSMPDGEHDYDLLRWNVSAQEWQLLPANAASTYQLLQKKSDGTVGYDWMRYI